MSFPGPLSIAPIHNDGQGVSLRSFQRITAQVLSVTGTTAILSVDGHPVVAQLTSADQMAALLSHSTAQFIVTQLTDQVVTLKFVKSEPNQAPVTGTVFNGPELATGLLEQNDVPVTVNNLMMARSMLKQHLPVTPRALNELLGALSEYGPWGEADADLAAAMKAAGLPVTAQSLALMSRQAAQSGEGLSQLLAMLTRALEQDFPPDLLKQLKKNLQTLNGLVIRGGGETSQLAEQLKAWVDALGGSLENILLETSQHPDELFSENSLVMLTRLQRMLEQFGEKAISGEIEKFLTDIRQEQFLNVKRDPVPGRGAWSEVGFAIQSAQQKQGDGFSSARLKIAREAESDKINPAYTRLIIQVDLEPGETVEVDLSLVGKKIRTSVIAPNPGWGSQAQSELPALEDALQTLGFTLKDTHIEVGKPKPWSGIDLGADSLHLMTVNIEV